MQHFEVCDQLTRANVYALKPDTFAVEYSSDNGIKVIILICMDGTSQPPTIVTL